jgi:anti-sigma factor RsiW
MQCDDVLPLIAGYLDGELSETQSGPVRQHLLDCPACRQATQDQKALKSWFRPTAPVAAPEGFAARVARRAFQGDPGLLTPQAPPAREEAGSLLRFAMNLTAVAAAALLVMSLALQLQKQPASTTLRADSSDLERALQSLDRLNEDERFGPARKEREEDQEPEAPR